jgi:uncharacterized membrane protein YgaE (UPF0421/DUF939 family)
MSKNILNEIVDEIDLKPNKTKLLLKWVIGISSSLIVGAFVFGQLKMSNLNRLDNIEKNIEIQSKDIREFRQEYRQGQEQLNLRIDKVYDDASASFESFQESNQRQLELIIDYGSDNQELLKEMLKLNAMERQQTITRNLEEAKNTPPENLSIGVKKVPHQSDIHFISVDTGDTLFSKTAVTQEFIDGLDTDLYVIEKIEKNKTDSKLFDVSYRNK